MTPKRRQYGSGSIYQRADGKWVGSFDAGWRANGNRRRMTVVAASKPEARRKLDTKQREFALTGPPVEGTVGRATVKSWSDTWLAIRKGKDRPKTYAARQSNLRAWIVPTLGTKRLDALTPGDLRRLTQTILAAGRSSTTAQGVQACLMKMLRDALVEGHPVPPRLLEVEGPAAAVNDREAIATEDAVALLVTAGGQSDVSRWAAALLQGMRQGECLGLAWDCVDLDAGTLDVSWQLQPIPFEHGCVAPCGRRFGGDCPARRLRIPHGYEVKQLEESLCLVRPKTAKGKRIIPLIPWMHNALAAWRQVAPVSPHGLVWPRPDGSPRRAKEDREDWYGLQDRAQVAHTEGAEGRRYLLHECRDTAVTLLLELRIDPGVVQAIVGHSNIITTRGYQLVRIEPVRDALIAAGERLGLV